MGNVMLIYVSRLDRGGCFIKLATPVIRDEGIRALFEEELRRRDELLELHLDMPGFFRELVNNVAENNTKTHAVF